MTNPRLTDSDDATKSRLYLAFFNSPDNVPGEQAIEPRLKRVHKTSLLYSSVNPSSDTDPFRTLVKYEKDGVNEGPEPVLSIVPYDPQEDSLIVVVDLEKSDNLKDQKALEEILQSVPVPDSEPGLEQSSVSSPLVGPRITPSDPEPSLQENPSVWWLWDAMKCLQKKGLIHEFRVHEKEIFYRGKLEAHLQQSSSSSGRMRKIRTVGAYDKELDWKMLQDL